MANTGLPDQNGNYQSLGPSPNNWREDIYDAAERVMPQINLAGGDDLLLYDGTSKTQMPNGKTFEVDSIIWQVYWDAIQTKARGNNAYIICKVLIQPDEVIFV